MIFENQLHELNKLKKKEYKKMKVFVVLEYDDEEMYAFVSCVFSTREKALEYITTRQKDYEEEEIYIRFDIEEHLLL
jgi:hypothetical protein